MSDANKAIFRRWFQEVWCDGREATIDELVAPDAVSYGLGESDPPTRGPAEFKAFWRTLRAAIPDTQVTVEDLVAENDKVVGRVVINGTHQGGDLGFPASGRRVRFAGVIILRIANGQLAEAWNSWDQLGLLQQIGAIPRAGATDRFTQQAKA